MTNYYFTSDTHFGHRNIIKYCNRPFADVDEMNADLIANWNSVVQPNDVVYHLGDVIFEKDRAKLGSMLRRLNGRKHIVWGNHDKGLQHAILDAGFTDCGEMHTLNVPISGNTNQRMVLCHYALRVWDQSHHGTWNLYGHSHGTLPDDPNMLSCDVGVDNWDYYPVSMKQLTNFMAKKTWRPIDHHGDRNM